MNDNKKKEQKKYSQFRSEFAIALVLITLGGPFGIFLGVALLIYLLFKKPKDMATMSTSLFLMFIWLLLAILVFVISIL